MKIRKFRKEDARKVSYLVQKSQDKCLRGSYSDELVNQLMKFNTPSCILKRSRMREFYVMVERDRILGVNALLNNELKTMFVNPRHHGKGIGRKLVNNIEKIVRKRKFSTLKVKSSLYAEGFYKKLGFRKLRIIHQSLNRVDLPDVLMVKKL